MAAVLPSQALLTRFTVFRHRHPRHLLIIIGTPRRKSGTRKTLRLSTEMLLGDQLVDLAVAQGPPLKQGRGNALDRVAMSAHQAPGLPPEAWQVKVSGFTPTAPRPIMAHAASVQR